MWLFASSINSYSYIQIGCVFVPRSALSALQLYYNNVVQQMHAYLSVCVRVSVRKCVRIHLLNFKFVVRRIYFADDLCLIRNMNIKRINKMKYNTAKVNCSAQSINFMRRRIYFIMCASAVDCMHIARLFS